MSRLRILSALTIAGVVLAASQWCWASSIRLISSSGGIYDYGLEIEPNEGISFFPNNTITLSGLSGVTGADTMDFFSPPECAFTVSSFTPSSVVYTEMGFCSPFNGALGPIILGTLTVDSSVLTLGTVDFSMTPEGVTVTGTTQGPVAAAAVPEPVSLLLLGTGMLGLVGIARRKWSRLS